MRRNAHNTRSLRNLNLVVRISPGELKALRRAARAAGVTVSVFVRDVFLHQVAAQSKASQLARFKDRIVGAVIQERLEEVGT